MTTSHYGYKAAAACFNPTHPEAKAWIADALREAHEELETWSDDNGGWMEAPHYAMVSYDALLGISIMANNAGLGGDLFHPKMKKVIEWLAKISTPPDSRYGGFRHLPPIGNTYLIEPTGEFGIVARLSRRDRTRNSQDKCSGCSANRTRLPVRASAEVILRSAGTARCFSTRRFPRRSHLSEANSSPRPA